MSRTGHAAPADSTSDAPSSKRFLALFALGMVGVVAVGIATATGEGGVPGLPELSGPQLAALAMLQPAVLLAVAVAVGLRSHVDERVRVDRQFWTPSGPNSAGQSESASRRSSQCRRSTCCSRRSSRRTSVA